MPKPVPYKERKSFYQDRSRFLVTFEAPSMAAKARLYLASEKRRISFNSWFQEYAVPMLDMLMNQQGVPSEPAAVFAELAELRPKDAHWKELAKKADADVNPKKGNARRR